MATESVFRKRDESTVEAPPSGFSDKDVLRGIPGRA